MAEEQEPLRPGTNSQPNQAEIEEMIQIYSCISDPVLRERLVALLKAMRPEPV